MLWAYVVMALGVVAIDRRRGQVSAMAILAGFALGFGALFALVMPR